MKRKKQVIALAFGAIALAAAQSASASLVYLQSETFSGTGLGSVSTVLTLQSPAGTSTEAGSVAFNGGADILTGHTQAQNATFSLGQLGSRSASDLRIVFNAVEPGPQSSVTLANLVLTIYSPTGALLFSSGAFTPITFPAPVGNGIGNSGFLFGLDAAQAAQVQLLAYSGPFANNRIGLLASVSDAQGGIETFFVGTTGNGVDSALPVSEPATLALLGLAFGGAALGGRRRKSA